MKDPRMGLTKPIVGGDEDGVVSTGEGERNRASARPGKTGAGRRNPVVSRDAVDSDGVTERHRVRIWKLPNQFPILRSRHPGGKQQEHHAHTPTPQPHGHRDPSMELSARGSLALRSIQKSRGRINQNRADPSNKFAVNSQAWLGSEHIDEM